MAKRIFTLFTGESLSSQEKVCDVIFYLIILLLPFERALKHGGGSFLQYFIVLFVFASLMAVKKYYSRMNLAIIFYAIFLFWGSIADLRATGWFAFRSIWFILRTWVVWVLMWVAYNMSIQSSRKAKKLIMCLVAMGSLVAIMRILGIGVDNSRERMEVMGANVNASARMLVLIILYTLVLLARGIRASVVCIICYVVVSLAAVYALIQTQSRGGTLALAFSVVGLSLTTKKLSRKVLYLALAGFALVGFVCLVVSNEALMDRFFNAYYNNETGGREGFINMSWYLLERSKVFGYGCIAHTLELGQAFGIEVRATHNTYMYGLMAAGYPGAVFYYLALIFIARSAWKIRMVPYGNFLFLICIMMLFSGYVMNIEGAKWLYVAYGVILGLSDRIKYAKKMHLPDEAWMVK